MQFLILRSNVKSSELINKIKDTLEVFTPPGDNVIYDILNRFIEGLYSGVINDIREATLEKNEDGVYSLSYYENGETADVRVCDVVKVVCGEHEYERVGEEYPARLCSEDEHFYKMTDDGVLSLYSTKPEDERILVYFRAVPPLHTADDDREIELPSEFMDLAEAKLYSEIYRVLGEDALCANWTEQYNMLMTRFGVWLEVHGL